MELSDIEDCLARKGWRNQFEPVLESVYLEDMGKLRQIVCQRSVMTTLVIYNLLLITDFFLLPKTAYFAALLHFGVVTPAILFLFFLHARTRDFQRMQIYEAGIPLLICGQVLAIMALNDNPNVGLYQFFVALILQYSAVNQRLELKVSNAVTAGILLVYAVVLWFQDLSLEAKLVGLVSAAVMSHLGYLSNMRAQRDARYGFLMRIREQVRLHMAEANALRDPLTGLRNRRYLERFAENLPVQGAARQMLSLMLLDIDFFKRYNDRHGHACGDACLRSVAGAIERSLAGSGGVAVRFGGEEFLVLLPGLEESRAIHYAELVRSAVEGLMIDHGMSGVGPHVTISAGVAAGETSAETLSFLIDVADAALYLAKARGRNRVQSALDSKVLDERRGAGAIRSRA